MNRKRITWLLVWAMPLFGENSMISLEGDPSVIIEGKVNAITGEPVIFQEDLVIWGAEPVRIARAYVSGPEGKWFWGIFGSLRRLKNGHLMVTEKNGTPMEYRKAEKVYVEGVKYVRYNSVNFDEGFSNTAHGKISSRTNLKNYYVLLNESSENFEVHCADGTVRMYEAHRGEHYLCSEKLPNGHWVLYEYEEVVVDKKKDLFTYNLKSIRTTNPAKTKVYARGDLQLEDPKLKNQHFFVTGSDGGSVEYQYRGGKRPHIGPMSAVISSCLPTQKLEFVKFTHKFSQLGGHQEGEEECRLFSMKLPLEREVRLEYYQRDVEQVAGQSIKMEDYWIGPLTPYHDPRRSRIKSIGSQVGGNDQVHATHSFTYDLKNKKTSVYEIDGSRTDYSWNRSFRLDYLERFSKEGKLLNAESYGWEYSKKNLGNLVCKMFLDENRTPVSIKWYFYGERGNVAEERFYGNLTGRSPPLMLDKGPIIPQGEFYARRFKYSSGEPSLLIEESDDFGVRIVYDYLPGTDLPLAEWIYDGQEVKLRKFWEYDEDHILIREIGDDGNGLDKGDFSGVKVRRIREITPFDSGRYVGMPEIVEEKYWENGSEFLLRREVLTYGASMRVLQRDVYDADGVFRYCLKMAYDEKGRLTQETNALGQVQSYEYDLTGNRIRSKDFSGRKTTRFEYDYSNRPTCVEMQGDDGVILGAKTSYDLKHQIVSEVDARGHETKHSYDVLGNRIKTELPRSPLVSSCTQGMYDAAGNQIRSVDGEGHETLTSYNAYGKPLIVIYADGEMEEYVYSLNGQLKTHIDPKGVSTSYVHDFLGRIVQKIVGDAEENYEYYGELLVAKTDAERNRTVYTYDGAGRKVAEELGEEKTTYSYDALGRLATARSDDHLLVYEYDLLDRLIEERGGARKVQYEYDAAGNQKTVIRFIAGKEALEKREYDSFGRLIEKRDALGGKEITCYEDYFLNCYGQKVFRKISVDQMGLQSIETFDALGRLASFEKRKEKTLFLEEKFYDRNGLLNVQADTIFSPESSRKVHTRWSYDKRGRLSSLTEADERVTRYEYTPRGELERKIKSDGTVISYDYNDLGHLISLSSSDGTVLHSMKYDRLGRLIWFDGITRTFDAKGRILSEIFPQGYSVQNRYDLAGRRVECSIPMANCAIEYAYNSFDLTRVTRKTGMGEELYSHDYLDYDLAGNLLKEKSIHGQEIVYTIDPLSRKTQIFAPQFSQQILKFDPVGNITQMRIQTDRIDYTYDDLYQLTSETGPFVHNYLFDSLNNRLQKDAETYQINALQQVVSHLQYDKNGNPTKSGTIKYTYDALDRLIRIEAPGLVKIFSYDALHRCKTKTTNREVRHFLYDNKNEIGSFDDRQSLIDLRILGNSPDAEIGASVAIELLGNTFAPVHDLQGNIAALCPLVSQPTFYRYSAFGEERIIGEPLCPWRYSSKRSDVDTGLVYFGRRFYLPELGRWLTPDPSGFKDGMNLYAYVHNDPLTSYDEYGLLTNVHGQGWQNCPWGSPFSYSSSSPGGVPFASPPEQWNRARVDARQIPSLDLYYKRSPHYYVNGILNTSSDSQKGAEALRQSLGGAANVIPLYSASEGTYKDLKSVRRIKRDSNYDSFAIWKLKREIKSSSLYMEGLNDPRKLFITAFSRGAGETFHAVKNLGSEEKNRLIITACGPIMILPRDLGFSVTNLISSGDWCSLFCNSALKKDPHSFDDVANVRMLDQIDGFSGCIKDHFFLSNTYQGEIADFTRKNYDKFGGPR